MVHDLGVLLHSLDYNDVPRACHRLPVCEHQSMLSDHALCCIAVHICSATESNHEMVHAVPIHTGFPGTSIFQALLASANRLSSK
jgi:hypothetical protein